MRLYNTSGLWSENASPPALRPQDVVERRMSAPLCPRSGRNRSDHRCIGERHEQSSRMPYVLGCALDSDWHSLLGLAGPAVPALLKVALDTPMAEKINNVRDAIANDLLRNKFAQLKLIFMRNHIFLETITYFLAWNVRFLSNEWHIDFWFALPVGISQICPA